MGLRGVEGFVPKGREVKTVESSKKSGSNLPSSKKPFKGKKSLNGQKNFAKGGKKEKQGETGLGSTPKKNKNHSEGVRGKTEQ